MSTPLISTIVPCYNQAEYLGDALESLIAQTYPHWEAVVIDDGSTDNTSAVAERFAARDRRIRHVHQPNQGLSAARNRGLDLARGDAIQFLDSDDYLLPRRFENALEARTRAGRGGVVLCDYWTKTPDGQLNQTELCRPEFIMTRPLHDLALRWETHLSIPVHTFLFEAEIFRQRSLRFDTSMPNHEDWAMWMRIFTFDPPVIRCRSADAVYRLHAKSMTRARTEMWRGYRMAIATQLARADLDAATRTLLRRKERITDDDYGRTWRGQAWRFLQGDPALMRHVPWPAQRLVRRLAAPPWTADLRFAKQMQAIIARRSR